ncbi:MAG TPA: hypothetical protein VH684_15695 [Xanthobacteraceae bacterium]|jgi:hypothetical protein
MPHCTDPYIDDPCFRDPSIVDRYGTPIGRTKFNQTHEGRAWAFAILGIGAILLIVGLALGPFGWEFNNTSPSVAGSPTTIGQAR